jgi:hypothetical protein
MAWTAPMTAVSGSVYTAAQFNQFVRDNLNETAPAKATTAGAHFAVSGTNEIAERLSASDIVTTSQDTTSTSYTDLSTVGPSVTATTGPRALVIVRGAISNSGTGSSRMSYEVSGASSVAAADAQCVGVFGTAGTGVLGGDISLVTGLTAGSNTFTAKYRVSSGTGTFSTRRIVVFPL